jgi:hypothetical protein
MKAGVRIAPLVVSRTPVRAAPLAAETWKGNPIDHASGVMLAIL